MNKKSAMQQPLKLILSAVSLAGGSHRQWYGLLTSGDEGSESTSTNHTQLKVGTKPL